MQLRPSTKYEGYYKLLHNGAIDTPKTRKSAYKPPNSLFPHIISDINCEILKRLTSSTTTSPIISFSLVISARFKVFLEECYGVSSKYVDGTRFLTENSMVVERFFNDTDSCAIDNNSFMLRFKKKRNRKFYVDKTMQTREFKGKHMLCIKFIVDDIKH